MTAQMHETIIIEGETYGMCAEPLQQYFDKHDIKFDFIPPHTACWRGYHGIWEIENNMLYLTEFTGHLPSNKKLTFKNLFPDQHRVFAEWYSGTLNIPKGELKKYVHMGYESVYDQNLLIEIEKGVVVKQTTITNQDEDTIIPINPDNFLPEK